MASKIGSFTLVLTLVALGASAVDFGAHAGYYANNVRRAYVGADVMIPVGMLSISPNLDYTRSNGIGLWFGNADVAFRFSQHAGPAFWLGAGPTYGYITGYGSSSRGYSNLQPNVTYPPPGGGGGSGSRGNITGFGNGATRDWGWDANAGVEFKTGAVTPYVTARYNKVKSMKATGLAVGLRFGR